MDHQSRTQIMSVGEAPTSPRPAAGSPVNARRRSISLASGAVVAAPWIVSRGALAADVTLKIANNVPITHPTNQRLREAVESIRKATGGRVNVQLFPNNQLGSDSDQYSQVRSGALDMCLVACAWPISQIPDTGAHGLAFAFKDYASVWNAMDGELGAHQRKLWSTLGLHVLPAAWDNGFRQITSRDRPIRRPEDLAGFKIRTPASELIVSIFESLGAATTSVNIKEVYAALQTRLVDGQENPMIIMDVFKFFEVQKYCSLSNHVWDGFWTTVNQKSWSSLPGDVQRVIETALTNAAKAQRSDVAARDANMQAALEKKGVTFVQPDHDAFRDKLRRAGYYDGWRKKVTPEAFALLERYAGKLG